MKWIIRPLQPYNQSQMPNDVEEFPHGLAILPIGYRKLWVTYVSINFAFLSSLCFPRITSSSTSSIDSLNFVLQGVQLQENLVPFTVLSNFGWIFLSAVAFQLTSSSFHDSSHWGFQVYWWAYVISKWRRNQLNARAKKKFLFHKISHQRGQNFWPEMSKNVIFWLKMVNKKILTWNGPKNFFLQRNGKIVFSSKSVTQ